jgi:hypothetical protein
MTTTATKLLPGTRCRFNKAFLQSTCQYTGPVAPTSTGPFARGTVVGQEPLGGWLLIRVAWDDGTTTNVNANNLEPSAR